MGERSKEERFMTMTVNAVDSRWASERDIGTFADSEGRYHVAVVLQGLDKPVMASCRPWARWF